MYQLLFANIVFNHDNVTASKWLFLYSSELFEWVKRTTWFSPKKIIPFPIRTNMTLMKKAPNPIASSKEATDWLEAMEESSAQLLVRTSLEISCWCAKRCHACRPNQDIITMWSRIACTQGRNEFIWRPGQEASLAPPCSNLRSFGSKCSLLYWRKYLWHCCDFSAPPAMIQHLGNCAPLAPLLRPCLYLKQRISSDALLSLCARY